MSEYESILAVLQARGVTFTIHEHAPLHTVADARSHLLFPLERLLKAVTFKHKAGGWILAGVRGPDRVDYRKLAAAAETRRADLVPLSPVEVAEVFGVEPGCVSPVVLRTDVQILLDSHLPETGAIFCGAGRPDRTLEIALADLVQLTGARTVPLASDPG
jgi:Cys-tRNA(Pro)/Cys-tRNA(Cys) deacylase